MNNSEFLLVGGSFVAGLIGEHVLERKLGMQKDESLWNQVGMTVAIAAMWWLAKKIDIDVINAFTHGLLINRVWEMGMRMVEAGSCKGGYCD